MAAIKTFKNFFVDNQNRSWGGKTYHISQQASVSLSDKLGYIAEFISYFTSLQDENGNRRITILGRDEKTAFRYAEFNYSIIAPSGYNIDELSIELPQTDPQAYVEEIKALNAVFNGAKEFKLSDFWNASAGTYFIDSSAPVSLKKKLLGEFIISNQKNSLLSFSSNENHTSFNVTSTGVQKLLLTLSINQSNGTGPAEVSALTNYYQQCALGIMLADFKQYRTGSNEYLLPALLPLEKRKKVLVNFFHALPMGGKSFLNEGENLRLHINIEYAYTLSVYIELSSDDEVGREQERNYLKDIPSRPM